MRTMAKEQARTDSHNRIFLCHASEDKEVVVGVYRRLKKAGLKPWLDKEDLAPGEDWQRAIRRAIQESAVVLVFLSKSSTSKRGYVQREFRLALDTMEEVPPDRLFLIPIRIDDCEVPDDLKRLHCARLEDLPRVISSIHSALGYLGEQTRAGPEPTRDRSMVGSKSARPIESLRPQLARETLAEMIRISPRLAVLDAFAVVEDSVRRAAQRHGIPTPHTLGVRANLSELERMKVIDSHVKGLFNELREKRDQIAHHRDIDVNDLDAHHYVNTAAVLATWLSGE